MGLRIYNVIHPKNGQTTHVTQRTNGMWVTYDGIVMTRDEIRSDSGDRDIICCALLFGVGMLIYQLF